jgi:peptidoglycan/LPS O-acetylase OafA/YrhL
MLVKRRCSYLIVSRIWPAHVVMLLATVFILKIPITMAFLPNLFLVQGWVPSENYFFSYNGVSWSISTELAFYLSFPFFIRRWGQTFWWKIPLAAAIVYCTLKACDIFGVDYKPGVGGISTVGLIYVSPLGRILEFVTGIACCSIFRWLWRYAPRNFSLFTVFEILSIFGCYFTMTGGISTYFDANVGNGAREWLAHSSSLPTCAIAVVVFAFGCGALSAALSSRPMLLLGEVSFSLYLTHQVVNNWYVFRLQQKGGLIGAVICASLALALSYLLWKFIEIPARKILRKVAPVILVHLSTIRLRTNIQLGPVAANEASLPEKQKSSLSSANPTMAS